VFDTSFKFSFLDWQSVQASENKMQSLNQWMESLQNKTEKFHHALKVLDQNKGSNRAEEN
jgi:hypothetical protein